MRYDIAIIGTGPAGLEAALTAKIRNKTVLLLGNARLSPKVEKAHAVLNYLGLPGVTGEAMRQVFQVHLDQLDIPITEDRIVACYAMGDYFALQGSNTGDMYEASTVILATGVSSLRLLPGEDTLLGRGVSYCATCDGMLYKGRRVAVLGYTPEAEAEANFLARCCASSPSRCWGMPKCASLKPRKPRMTWTPCSFCAKTLRRTSWCQAWRWREPTCRSTCKWKRT